MAGRCLVDNGDDLESVLRQVLAEYRTNGVDIVLGVCYTDGVGQKGHVIKYIGDNVSCRKLGRMLWVALQDESTPSKAATTVEEDDD
jgi:hypothetical protein